MVLSKKKWRDMPESHSRFEYVFLSQIVACLLYYSRTVEFLWRYNPQSYYHLQNFLQWLTCYCQQ